MRSPLFWLGFILVVAGALILLYITYILIQLVQSPEESGLIEWVVKNIGSERLFLSGHIDQTPFEIEASVVL